MILLSYVGRLLHKMAEYRPSDVPMISKDELEATKKRAEDIQSRLAMYEAESLVTTHVRRSRVNGGQHAVS